VQTLVISISLVLLPLSKYTVAYAQSTNPQTTPICNLNLTQNQPGVFCEREIIEIKPGNSNDTEEVIRKENERVAEAKRAAAARKAAQSSAPKSTDLTVLYNQYGQCVPFARAATGLNAVKGIARYIKINSLDPIVGSVVITYESSAGHAAEVVAVTADYIQVLERNFIPSKVTLRKIARNSGVIKGYVIPNS